MEVMAQRGCETVSGEITKQPASELLSHEQLQASTMAS